jgi:hypothetical protein
MFIKKKKNDMQYVSHNKNKYINVYTKYRDPARLYFQFDFGFRKTI